MTGTTISTSTTVGVSLTAASQNPVTVAPSGTINVTAAYASAIYGALGVPSTLTNDGVLQAANGYGARFRAGGTITNGSASDTKASISGGVNGVRFDIHGTGKLANFGTITSTTGSGVYGLSTDNIANGSTSDGAALIAGYKTGISLNGLTGTIANFGMISGSGTSSTGIHFRQGGVVTNGDAAHTAASVIGVQSGINMAHNEGTVRNFGTIAGSGPQGSGVNLNAGGTVVNGSNSDTAACILAAGPRTALYVGGSAGTVTNFGTIKSAGRTGVVLIQGGTVTNGSATDTKALISGANNGIYMRADAASAVFNFGTISGAQDSGVSIYQDGQITNGSAADTVAQIAGGTGIYLGSGTIVNFGTVTGWSSNGIRIGESATIRNGDATHKNALISSTATTSEHSGIYVNLGAAAISNFGTIKSASAAAIHLNNGGTITNGSTADITALISSTVTTSTHSGIYVDRGTTAINNFGTIKSASASAIHLNNGGTVTNGSTADTTALIQGSTSGSSILVQTGQTTINNFGTIGNGASGASGINLGEGGKIVNGSAASAKASIIGGSGTTGTGIFISSGSLGVSNFGTVSGGSTGISFGTKATGTVVNGSTAVTTSLITGNGNGISANGSIGVANFASIAATVNGVFLGSGGSIVNGSAADTKASIIGVGNGIFVNSGTAHISNFGTIATIGTGGVGVHFNGTTSSPGTVVNGSATDTKALITGSFSAIFANGGPIKIANYGTLSGNTAISLANGTIGSAATVENFGSVVSNFGSGGTAIRFGDQADRLILHPGASIVGKVFGGAGSNTLELASGGGGTVGSIGASFMGFTALAVDGGTTWTLASDNTIGAVSNAGSLTLAPWASLHVTTAVDPASTGIFKLDASSLLEVLADKGISNKIQFIGAGELIVDKAANFGTNVGKPTYNGPLIQSFTSGASIDLKDVSASATLSYTAATGLLQISNAAIAVATLKFDNATPSLGFHGADDGTGHLLITHS